MQLPADIRARIEAEAEGLPFADLRRAVELLSERYRSGASTRDLNLAPSFRTAAYMLTRFPATFSACDAVMREAAARLPACESLLDLGAGAGPASLAALAHFGPSLGEITCVERDPYFARTGAGFLPHARWIQSDFAKLKPLPPHDLIVLSYALGELAREEAARVVEAAMAACRVGVAIVEPGTPRGFALIESLRGKGEIAAPCTSGAPCPMKAGDWCHFAARVERSSLHRRLKGGTLGHEDEKFSYLILARNETRTASARVIRHPQHRPGLIQLRVCADGAALDVKIPHGDRARFAAARKIAWGGDWDLPTAPRTGEPTRSA